MKELLTEFLKNILTVEYTDQEKQRLGIPQNAWSSGGKWYTGDEKNKVYVGRVRSGKFIPASVEPEPPKKTPKGSAPKTPVQGAPKQSPKKKPATQDGKLNKVIDEFKKLSPLGRVRIKGEEIRLASPTDFGDDRIAVEDFAPEFDQKTKTRAKVRDKEAGKKQGEWRLEALDPKDMLELAEIQYHWQIGPQFMEDPKARKKRNRFLNRVLLGKDGNNPCKTDFGGPIFRGMSIPATEINKFLSQFVVGETTHLPPSGFSADPELAAQFSSTGGFMASDISVIIRINPAADGTIVGLHCNGAGEALRQFVEKPRKTSEEEKRRKQLVKLDKEFGVIDSIEYSDDSYGEESEIIRPSFGAIKVTSITKLVDPDNPEGGKVVIECEDAGVIVQDKYLGEWIVMMQEDTDESADDILVKYLNGPVAPKKRTTNEVLTEFLGKILGEGESPTYPGYYRIGGRYYSRREGGEITHKSADGNIVALSAKEKKQVNAGRKKSGAAKQKKPGRPKQPKTTPQVGRIGSKGDASNKSSLESFIRTGTVLDRSGKESRPPGNEFSRYSEAVSSAVAGDIVQELIDDPNYPTEDIVERVIQLDCDSALLTDGVSEKLPAKKSPLYAEFEATEQSGVFESCGTEYSREQNFARYLTAVVARTKAQRMAVGVRKLSEAGSIKGTVTTDAFSGDAQSLNNMRSRLASMPAGARIFTETGQELTREEAEKMIGGFGSSAFPADTALMTTDSNGNIVLMGFSDKKELNAIINNTGVASEVNRNVAVIDAMLTRGKITQEQADEAKRALQESGEEFADAEAEIIEIGKEPVLRVLEAFSRSDNTSEQNTIISRLKDSAPPKKGGDPDKARYFRRRISEPFAKAAAKDKPSKADDRDYLQWLRSAGWVEGKPTPQQMTHAWALRCQAYLNEEIKDKNGAPKDLPAEDLQLLFGSGIADQKEMNGRISKIRSEALGVLAKQRTALDKIQVTDGLGLGTYLDAVGAWEALHLGMREYKGALTIVARDTVVDFDSVEECLKGITSPNDFARNLQISSAFMTSRDAVDKDGNFIVTGQKVEVFSVNRGEVIRVGVKSLRPKSGTTGRLQITWNYHPDMQRCLKAHSKK